MIMRSDAMCGVQMCVSGPNPSLAVKQSARKRDINPLHTVAGETVARASMKLVRSVPSILTDGVV